MGNTTLWLFFIQLPVLFHFDPYQTSLLEFIWPEIYCGCIGNMHWENIPASAIWRLASLLKSDAVSTSAPSYLWSLLHSVINVCFMLNMIRVSSPHHCWLVCCFTASFFGCLRQILMDRTPTLPTETSLIRICCTNWRMLKEQQDIPSLGHMLLAVAWPWSSGPCRIVFGSYASQPGARLPLD